MRIKLSSDERMWWKLVIISYLTFENAPSQRESTMEEKGCRYFLSPTNRRKNIKCEAWPNEKSHLGHLILKDDAKTEG